MYHIMLPGGFPYSTQPTKASGLASLGDMIRRFKESPANCRVIPRESAMGMDQTHPLIGVTMPSRYHDPQLSAVWGQSIDYNIIPTYHLDGF